MMRTLAAMLLLAAWLVASATVSAQSDTGAVPAAPDDGGPRHWEVTDISSGLNLREQPSTSSRIVLTYPPGTILSNLGCQRTDDKVWCDVQKLGGGPRGYVAATYIRPAVAPDGSVPTGPDNSALRAGQGDFDATGKIPCSQVKGQPSSLCDFGVSRAGSGYATVVVTKPDGVSRSLYFVRGQLLGADTSQADGYSTTSSEK